MEKGVITCGQRYRAFGRQHLRQISQLSKLTRDQRIALRAVAAVLPFRVNSYILDELIDWDNIPTDPLYQLTFPQAGMLEPRDFLKIQDLVVCGASDEELQRAADSVRMRMNPHPAGQLDLNLPSIDGEPLVGCQHKYRETVLYFPSQGQTCHAYCTYCFRWPQFVGGNELKLAANGIEQLVRYLRVHDEVSDVLITGGDPMIMSSSVLRRHIEPLLDDRLEHLTSIRIGSKALSYWPYRFISDHDADDLLSLLEQVRRSGRQLAFMAHFSHPNELHTNAVRLAMQRIIATGATIRCQAPLIRHVNDRADAWAAMWTEQVRLGAIPYYMFVERNTGPQHYFEVPLGRALRIFSNAFAKVSGLARTVRGPSMSATPGKILLDGVTSLPGGDKLFVLKMIQGRDAEWANRVFFAQFDSQAAWLSDLRPPYGEQEFFFAPYLRGMCEGSWQPAWRRSSGCLEDQLQVG